MSSAVNNAKSPKRRPLNMHYNSPRTITGHLLHSSRHTKIKPRPPLSAGMVIYGHRDSDTKIKKDTKEAVLKRSHDGANSVSVTGAVVKSCGVRASKKRAFPQSSMCVPAKGPAGKCLNTNPAERDLLDVENSARWNSSFQALRLEKEWNDLSQCRTLKKNSQMMKHRENKLYVMNGAGITLKPRYDVDEEELRVLKEFSRARKVSHDEYMKNSRNSSSRSFIKDYARRGDYNNWNEMTQSPAEPSGHWASDGMKTPVHKTDDTSKDRNSSSTFDKSMKDKDGEGKLKETAKEKRDNKIRETNNITDKEQINSGGNVNNSDGNEKEDKDSSDDNTMRQNGSDSHKADVSETHRDSKITKAET